MRERFSRYPGDRINRPDTDTHWTIFHKQFSDYMNDFKLIDQHGIIPEHLDLLKTLPSPVVVDLMAPTTALRSLSRGILRHVNMHGIAVGIADHRKDAEKHLDDESNVEFFTGNLRRRKTWEELKKKVGTADFIMERGFGGLLYLPNNLWYHRQVIGHVWDMLHPEHGLAVLQIPPKYALDAEHVPTAEWLHKLRDAKIRYAYLPSYTSQDANMPYGLLMLLRDSKEQVLPSVFTTKR